MKIITTDREIIYSDACGCSAANGEMTSNVALSVEEKRAMFQKWYNVNKLNRNVVLREGVAMAGGLKTDGVKDEKTTNAYKKFGAEFEKEFEAGNTVPKTQNPAPEIKNPFPEKDKPKNKGIGGMLDTMTGLFTKDEANPAVSSTKTPEQVKADKKKKMIKVALIAGGAIALTVIIIAIVKRKK
jgi:hypothetical protein